MLAVLCSSLCNAGHMRSVNMHTSTKETPCFSLLTRPSLGDPQPSATFPTLPVEDAHQRQSRIGHGGWPCLGWKQQSPQSPPTPGAWPGGTCPGSRGRCSSPSPVLTGKIKASAGGSLVLIWLPLEGILAPTVVPPQAPGDIIYTLISSSQLLPGWLPEDQPLFLWGRSRRPACWGVWLESWAEMGQPLWRHLVPGAAYGEEVPTDPPAHLVMGWASWSMTDCQGFELHLDNCKWGSDRLEGVG